MRFHFLAAAIAAIASGNNLAEKAAWLALVDVTCDAVAPDCNPEACSDQLCDGVACTNLCDGAKCTSDDACQSGRCGEEDGSMICLQEEDENSLVWLWCTLAGVIAVIIVVVCVYYFCKKSTDQQNVKQIVHPAGRQFSDPGQNEQLLRQQQQPQQRQAQPPQQMQAQPPQQMQAQPPQQMQAQPPQQMQAQPTAEEQQQKATDDWAVLKKKIAAAIKKDEQPEIFQALLNEVVNFVTEAKRNGTLDALSVDLQDDAATFFSRRRLLSENGSKEALQKINNTLKNQ